MSHALYHLALAEHWAEAAAAGDYRISGLGLTLEGEGFIHCSFAHQVQATADRFYGGRDDVLLLTIDPTRLPAEVRVEEATAAREGFPHIYGPLTLDAVVDVRPLHMDPDGRVITGL